MPKRASLRLFAPELSNSFPYSQLAARSTYKYGASELSHSFVSSPVAFPTSGYLPYSCHDLKTALPSSRRSSLRTTASLLSGGSSFLQPSTDLPLALREHTIWSIPTTSKYRLEVSTKWSLGLFECANAFRCLLTSLNTSTFSTTSRINGLLGSASWESSVDLVLMQPRRW